MVRIPFFFILCTTFSFANACENKRLDKDPNVLARVPAWDQGVHGTCWAFAADQIGFTKEILSFICKEIKPMKSLPDLQATVPATGESLIEKRIELFQMKLDEKLVSNNPIGIRFCSSSVFNEKSVVHPGVNGEWECDEESFDIAVIVGSRRDSSGQCKYLIRDSNCNGYEEREKKGSGEGWTREKKNL